MRRPYNKNGYEPDAVKDAIVKSQGRVYKAAELLGCPVSSLYDVIDRNPEFKQLIEQTRARPAREISDVEIENALDAFEGNVKQAAHSLNISTVTFYKRLDNNPNLALKLKEIRVATGKQYSRTIILDQTTQNKKVAHICKIIDENAGDLISACHALGFQSTQTLKILRIRYTVIDACIKKWYELARKFQKRNTPMKHIKTWGSYE